MAQITGVSMRWSVTVGISSVLRWETPPPASAPPIPPPAAVSLRSSPEQNPRPSPVKTIARTSVSRSYSVSFRPNAVSISTLIAFIRSGRLSLRTATCPSFSAIKSLIEISSTHRCLPYSLETQQRLSTHLTGLWLRVCRFVLLVQFLLRRRGLVRGIIGADSHRILRLSVDGAGLLARFVAELCNASQHRICFALLAYRT